MKAQVIDQPAQPANGTQPLTTQEQANELLAKLQALGVQFVAVAIGPRGGTQVPVVEFLPEGWKVQVLPVVK